MSKNKIKSKVHFDTHIRSLSGRFNIKLENIEIYCSNNNVSTDMKSRIITQFELDTKA